jgi:predicted nicotinamide N-methyase
VYLSYVWEIDIVHSYLLLDLAWPTLWNVHIDKRVKYLVLSSKEPILESPHRFVIYPEIAGQAPLFYRQYMTNLRLRYQTIEFGDTDIHLCTLRDKQQFHDPDGMAEKLGISSATWPLFGIVWPSSLVLARLMDEYSIGNKRVLEIGCGIGLPSLLLNEKKADITATDYHPEVEAFLDRNTDLNNGKAIEFELVDWESSVDQLGRFDLIIGSDLLYEDQHVKLLANFIVAHSNPKCEVILVDPGRGRKGKMTTLMAKYGYEQSIHEPAQDINQNHEFKGHIIKFTR